MTRKEFGEKMYKDALFINEFLELCKKHGLGLMSEDPYCGLEIVPLDEVMDYYNDSGSFGRWEYEYAEKNLED